MEKGGAMRSDIDVLIDEANENGRATVASSLRALMAASLAHLQDAREGSGSAAVEGAAEQVKLALDVLTCYYERLVRLGQELQEMELLAAGWTKAEDGTGWRRVEDEE